MIFNTWTFALFGTIVLPLYWLAVPKRWKPHFLVVAGTIFYACSVPAYLALIFALALITYGAARVLVATDRGPNARRLVFTLAVVAIVAVLGFFKYSKLLAATVDAIARHHILPAPQVVVPLAISFFTFEFVHVLVDAYQRKLKAIDPLEFAVFAMFFPTLVAGPIKRYESFAPQVRAIGPLTRDELALNAYRIGLGLFKKIVLADSLSVFTQPILTPGAPYGRADYWIAALAYAGKIYFDFTGYSDIAIGIAGLLGLEIPENFDRPYWAPNIAAFWRRWHMSLSSWIRDYIFIPLGGSRRPPAVVVVNLFVAMAVAGLWHGAAWTFVVWGLWHGLGLAVHRVWSMTVVPTVPLLSAGGRAVTALSIVATFAFVDAGWILFAATSFPGAATVYRGLFTG
jgi:alginate O-acetyltransferase complex protein AlgI